MNVGKRLGRPGSRLGEKTLVFPHKSPTMLPPGLCTQVLPSSHELALPRWGFSHLGRQTEFERIPRPRKYFGSIRPVTLHRPFSHSDSLRNHRIRSSPIAMYVSIFLDEAHRFPVARNLGEALFRKHIGCVFCSARGPVCASSPYHPVSLVVLCVVLRIWWDP